jgi:c-di-GMP-binding flagellar brake protein YcgR
MTASNLAALPVGSIVQVSTEQGSTKYLTHLVGIEPEKVIITAVPSEKQLGNNASYDSFYCDFRVLIFRILGEGIVYGFKSEVLHRVHERAHLLVSTYPKDLQTRNLRRESRYSCTLASSLRFNDSQFTGVIINISAHGCQFYLANEVEQQMVEKIKNYKDPIQIDIHLPFADGPSSIEAMIKSASMNDKNGLVLGTAFIGESQPVKAFLDSLRLDTVPSFIHS